MAGEADRWGWSAIPEDPEDPSNDEEPEVQNTEAPPNASRPKKELKDMTKKELMAHCNSLVKQVAKKQITIEDLRKKKGVPNTVCAECKVKDQVYENQLTDAMAEARNEKENYRGEIEDLEVKNGILEERHRKT